MKKGKGKKNGKGGRGRDRGRERKRKSNMNEIGRDISEGRGNKGKRKSYLPILCSVHSTHTLRISVQLVANFYFYFTSYKL